VCGMCYALCFTVRLPGKIGVKSTILLSGRYLGKCSKRAFRDYELKCYSCSRVAGRNFRTKSWPKEF